MIRRASDGDAAALGALEAELFGVGAWPPTDLLAQARRAWVAVDGTAVVGYVVTGPGGDVVELLRLGVRPDRRRHGLGGRLLRAALDDARADPEAERMLLEVGEANAAATALYARHGFSVIDRRRRYYPDGEDALVMQRTLRLDR